AAAAALGDDEHVRVQRERYAARRAALRRALTGHGFRIEHSEAGLYLWATRDESCWDTGAHLADRGVLGAPGDCSAPAAGRCAPVAVTAADGRVRAAVDRLTA